MKKGMNSIADLRDWSQLNGLGIGNVYYVIQTTNLGYTNFMRDMQDTYSDGSLRVHSTITSALAATVGERNDYVIVMPDSSDYDEGATLTMSKANVHLICPAGLGAEFGTVRGATIDPNASAHAITVTGTGVEVAGFWIRGYAEKYCITSSGTAVHIHHNDCAIASTSSSGTDAGGITVSGAGSKVERNFVFTNAGTSATVAFGIQGEAGGTRINISKNVIMVSNGCTMTVGISTGGNDVMTLVEGNVIGECAAGGSTLAGTVTAGITVGTGGFAVNNRVGLATEANGVTGGTANQSFIANYEGSSGGTLLT